MFDLHDSEEKLRNNSKSDKFEQRPIPSNIDSKKKAKITDIKKISKRKFVSELVNPNAKRRKNKGAKFVSDDGEESSNKDKLSKCSEYSKNEDDI